MAAHRFFWSNVVSHFYQRGRQFTTRGLSKAWLFLSCRQFSFPAAAGAGSQVWKTRMQPPSRQERQEEQKPETLKPEMLKNGFSILASLASWRLARLLSSEKFLARKTFCGIVGRKPKSNLNPTSATGGNGGFGAVILLGF
jgi:hypothetical protein